MRTRAMIIDCLRGVFTTRRYTNPRLPYPILPSIYSIIWWDSTVSLTDNINLLADFYVQWDLVFESRTVAKIIKQQLQSSLLWS